MSNVSRGGGTKLLFTAGPSSSQESKSALANLPSFDAKNFSKFLPSSACRSGGGKRPSVYLPLNDQPHTQVITSEKTNILLRYLHYQTGHKKTSKRRDPSPSEEVPRKRPRDEPTTTDMDTNAERSDDD